MHLSYFESGKFGQAYIHKCCIRRRDECYTRRDRNRKEGVLVNTHIHMGVHTRTFTERREEEIRNSIEVGSPIQQDAVYLNKK